MSFHVIGNRGFVQSYKNDCFLIMIPYCIGHRSEFMVYRTQVYLRIIEKVPVSPSHCSGHSVTKYIYGKTYILQI